MDYHANYLFLVPRGCPYVSHILFADDTLIFVMVQGELRKLFFQVIANYKRCARRKVNKIKSAIFCQSNASISRISIKESSSGIPSVLSLILLSL